MLSMYVYRGPLVGTLLVSIMWEAKGYLIDIFLVQFHSTEVRLVIQISQRVSSPVNQQLPHVQLIVG